MIAGLDNFTVLHAEGIVVLAAGMAGCFGTVTKLHSLNGTDGHNGMNRQNHSEPENRLTPEEQQEFLELLAQLSPEQREALKEVLKSFT